MRKNKTNKNKASVQILEKYTRTLIKYKVIYGNCGNLTKGKIFMVMKEYQAKNSGNRWVNFYAGCSCDRGAHRGHLSQL